MRQQRPLALWGAKALPTKPLGLWWLAMANADRERGSEWVLKSQPLESQVQLSPVAQVIRCHVLLAKVLQ
jgi:hypothetical protein